jgi:hypothetical protein
MNESGKDMTIVVTGDVTFDWNLAHIEKTGEGASGWSADAVTRACWQRGGAALLTDLTRTAANRIDDGIIRVVRPNKAPQEQIFPSAAAYHRSYAIWNPYKYEKGQKNENGDDV